MAADRAPPAVFVYGVLGLIPFFAPVAVMAWKPDFAIQAAALQAMYGALILSFLGGARWGFAVLAPKPDPLIVTLSMLPTLFALAIVTLSGHWPRFELIALAGGLLAQWSWDLRAASAPPWFSRLRTLLTLGAVAGLSVGAWAIG